MASQAFPIVHSIKDVRPPQQTLAPVGMCIYCRQSSSPSLKLTREHVLADALGGDLVLPEASCGECQKKINVVESGVLNSHFWTARNALGFQSRKRRGTKARRTYWLGTGDEELEAVVSGDVALPVRECAPGMPFMLLFEQYLTRPGILIGGMPGMEQPWRTYAAQPIDNEDRAEALYGTRDMILKVEFTTGHFQRFLAKTAHAFAVSQMGLDGFRPYLTQFILDGGQLNNGYHIGCAPLMVESLSESLHFLHLGKKAATQFALLGGEKRNIDLIIVTLLLFGKHTAPIYQVVVGEADRAE